MMNGLFIGLTTVDIQYFTDRFPGSNTKVKTPPPELFVGGPASNAAIVYSHLGGKASLASVVGRNPFTPFIAEDFKNHKIRHYDLAEDEDIYPVVATVITSGTNGDRAILASNPLQINPYHDFGQMLENVSLILIDGFYPEVATKILEIAKSSNIPIVMDGRSWKPQYTYLFPYIDYAICSADFFPPGCKNTDDVFDYLHNKHIPKIAITRGDKPILWSQVEKIETLNINPTEVVDTLGAGDFFHGAFAYYIQKQNSFKDSLQKAAEVASKSCRYKGTREWLKYQIFYRTSNFLLNTNYN